MRNKQIKLYIVEDLNNADNFISCIVSDKQDFLEYVTYRLRQENLDHFTRWADCHNADVNSEKDFVQYMKDVIPEQVARFVLHEIKFTPAEIASIMRLFHNCTPVGASYELDAERKAFEIAKKVMSELIKEEEKKQEEDIFEEGENK